jgi:hypothetical protein
MIWMRNISAVEFSIVKMLARHGDVERGGGEKVSLDIERSSFGWS